MAKLSFDKPDVVRFGSVQQELMAMCHIGHIPLWNVIRTHFGYFRLRSDNKDKDKDNVMNYVSQLCVQWFYRFARGRCFILFFYFSPSLSLSNSFNNNTCVCVCFGNNKFYFRFAVSFSPKRPICHCAGNTIFPHFCSFADDYCSFSFCFTLPCPLVRIVVTEINHCLRRQWHLKPQTE